MKSYIKIFSAILIISLIFCSCDFGGASSETESNEIIDTSCEHIDTNDDGKCDLCNDTVIIYIDFYAINDLHGKFNDTDSNEGVDELTTYLKLMQQIDDHTVFLSSGDMWQGSSESNFTKGLIVTEWMNHLDFSSMTLGNHEYDWGEEYIELNDNIAEFPFLAINIFDKETDNRVEYCDASVVIERGGIKIGIIGAIGDCHSSISGDKSKNIYFKTGTELTALVINEAERLRSNGVDYIVYSVHDGYGDSNYSVEEISDGELMSYYHPKLSEGYIDLVFEGHSHQKYVLIDEEGVYHLQNGGENKGISHVEIAINSITDSSHVSAAEIVSSSVYSKYSDDSIVMELLDKYKDDIAKGELILGTNDRKRDSTEIKQLVAKLYCESGEKLWGDDYDIFLGGGFISTRNPYYINAGEVIYSDIQAVLPFDNSLVLCSVNGSSLLSKFIETNNSNYYIFLSEYGKFKVDQIDPDETYYIITDTYTSSYAPNNLTVVDEYPEDIFARDLIAEYIQKGGWKSGD